MHSQQDNEPTNGLLSPKMTSALPAKSHHSLAQIARSQKEPEALARANNPNPLGSPPIYSPAIVAGRAPTQPTTRLPKVPSRVHRRPPLTADHRPPTRSLHGPLEAGGR